MYVLFTMWSKLWIDIFVLMMFLRKEDFPCPFFLPTMKGNLGDKFAQCLDFQESCADGEFLVVELQMPRSWMGECFTLFFSKPSTGKFCRVKIWRAASQTPAKMAALWTSSVSRDPALSFGKKRWPTRDAFVVTWNSRSFNLLGNEKTSHKDWNPFKTAGENVSSTTKRQISGIRRERLNKLCQSKKKAVFKNCF